MKRLCVLFSALSLAVACGETETEDISSTQPESTPQPSPQTLTEAEPEGAPTPQLAPLNEELFTFLPVFIEIDRLDGGTSTDFGDANLHGFVGTDAQVNACATPGGADPVDGTCDARLPAAALAACTSPGQGTLCRCTGDPALDTPDCEGYIDWNELLTDSVGAPDPARLATHRILDAVKTDPDSFKNDSCVTSTKVLGKMDITSAAVVNNAEYAYLALKRFDNNGDAGYTWLFNKVSPALDPAFGSCSSGDPLVYEISEGDVLVSGNFNPSAGAELLVRRASSAADGLKFIAADIVDPALMTGGNAVWEAIPGLNNVAAVNTTDASLGVFENVNGTDEGADRTDKGAISGSAGAFEVAKNIFAEAGVDLEAFIGTNGSLCGAQFYGSVITQPSSSKTSDLKDLLGPRLFNFGSLTATASMLPSCDKKLSFSVDTVVGPGIDTTDPDNVPGLSCAWTFTNEDNVTQKFANTCSGTLNFAQGDPTGSWSGSVQVTVNNLGGCSTNADGGAVEVYDPLSTTVTLTPFCDSTFNYSNTPTGGKGSYTYQWTFTPDDGTGTVTPIAPASTTTQSGSASVDQTNEDYTGAVVVTDGRTDIVCKANGSKKVRPLAPIQVNITPDATNLTCPDANFTDAIKYTASASGGDGNYTYTWSGCSSVTAMCTVNPADNDFCHDQSVYVNVDDGSTLCAAKDSETEQYSKVTTVTSTNN